MDIFLKILFGGGDYHMILQGMEISQFFFIARFSVEKKKKKKDYIDKNILFSYDFHYMKE